jgi:hypothetical protein
LHGGLASCCSSLMHERRTRLIIGQHSICISSISNKKPENPSFGTHIVALSRHDTRALSTRPRRRIFDLDGSDLTSSTNLRLSLEQSSAVLMKMAKAVPKRNLLLAFDAFGTLFTPKQPIAVQYGDLARKHGLSNFTDQELEKSFRSGKFPPLSHNHEPKSNECISFQTRIQNKSKLWQSRQYGHCHLVG